MMVKAVGALFAEARCEGVSQRVQYKLSPAESLCAAAGGNAGGVLWGVSGA